MERELQAVLRTLDSDAIFTIWNEYARENRSDDELYEMEMFNEIYAGVDPLEIATRCFYGCDEWNSGSSFNPNRDYFYYDGYGNPISLDYLSWNEYAGKYSFDYFDESAIIDYIYENDEDFGIEEIREALDNWDGEEE